MKLGHHLTRTRFAALRLTLCIAVALTPIACVKRVTQTPAMAGASQPAPAGPALNGASLDKKAFVQLTSSALSAHDIEVPPPAMRTQLIYPGDHLEVSIYEKLPVSQEKRSEAKRVNENGSILVVPIGEVAVAGLSITEAQGRIEQGLSPYVISPFCEISIVKREYTPTVYIFGEVTKNGSVPIERGDRILDVLSEVGGCKADAYRRSLKVIRLIDSTVTMYSIDLAGLMDEGKIDQNILVRDQDIIYVPRRFLTTYQEVMAGLANLMPWYLLIKTF